MPDISSLMVEFCKTQSEIRSLQDKQYGRKRELVRFLLEDGNIDCLEINFSRVARCYQTPNPKYNR